jgi:tetratricopeptide (TPR) repeat protein
MGSCCNAVRKSYRSAGSILAALCVLSLLFLIASKRADAQTPGQTGQITVEMLLGNAVSDGGSGQYKEVESAMQEFFGKRNLTGARDFLKAAKKKFPKLAPAEVMMAQLLAAAGQAAMARQELERGVVEDPKDPEFYVIFGRLGLQEGRFTDAELQFNKAEAVNAAFNDNAKRKRNFTLEILSGLATVAESRNKPEYWQVALDRLTAYLKEDPDKVSAHQRRGLALFRLNKPAEAMAAFKAADEAGQRTKTPALPAEVLMGRLYEEASNDPSKSQQQRDAAKAEAQKLMMAAAQAAPKDLETQLAVAQWALQAGKMNEALQYADVALKLDANSSLAQLTRGLVARILSDMRTAEDCFEAAFKLAPTDLGASNQLALVLVEQGDKDKQRRAAELAERNMRSAPGNREAAATLGWVYFNMGRYDEAERAMAQAATGGATSPDGAYYIAKIYEQKGKYAEAKLVLQQALDAKQSFIHRRDAEVLKTQLERRTEAAKTPTTDK